jgi:hypothetical protein
MSPQMPEPEEERVGGRTLQERTLGMGWEVLAEFDAAFERGEIDATEWHRRVGAIIGPAYLAATNPRAQSGQSGTPEQWERARRFVFAAVDRDGTLLDIGCANGHLLECAVTWLAESGYRIQPYGLEIVPELAELARKRLPQWADRIATGNAMHWIPERPFDFVHTRMDYVPRVSRPAYVQHLLEHVVAPGGRLIVGAHSEPSGTSPQLEAEFSAWGFAIAGRVEVPHTEDHRVARRAFWLDKPAVE